MRTRPHVLTMRQEAVVQQLLARAISRHGELAGYRLTLHLGGIISAVLGGRVGNSQWGRSMLGRRGGQATARNSPHLLKRASARGVLVRQANKKMREEYGDRYDG